MRNKRKKLVVQIFKLCNIIERFHNFQNALQMSSGIIIRLQNLPWTANAEDIRRFFDTLVIPDGGVHIIGGERGDAFIVFG